ncbi:hypothetical protein QL285_022305 [Trifolium repens]|nr:hypothetical protein QL285_022305 [Trifolium repens]
MNWTKWSVRLKAFTAENPIQDRTKDQREPKVLHDKNKCRVVSMPPQPVTQSWRSGAKMPQEARFAFVGSRSRMRRHARIDTFNGTCLCQIRSSASPKITES